MMSPRVARAMMIAIDVVVLSMALWLAFLVRFEFVLPLQMFKRLMFVWPYVVTIQFVVLAAFGVQRFIWRYVGLREAWRILMALGAATLAFVVVRVLAGQLLSVTGYAQYGIVPFGVIFIDFMLAFLGVTGVRALRRMTAESQARIKRTQPQNATLTLLVGAGEAGLLVAKEIRHRPDLGIVPLGFIDDDAFKQGATAFGLPILGRIEDIGAIAAKTGATQALITIANTSGQNIRRITDACRAVKLTTKIIPGVYEIVGGRVNLSRIRDVSIHDLLRREPVTLDTQAIAEFVRDRVVMVTGAGGSIGQELCRQVARFSPGCLVMVDQAETSLFYAERELLAESAETSFKIEPVIGDICNEARMHDVFATYRPDVVFHAAAYKHVPLMEQNPQEALRNNVLGTRIIADLAGAFGVSAFVMVSTDKAVNPSSVMGASKRVAEMYVQSLTQRGTTRYVTVRFGNVLGSAGSVIPIFKEQIARGGPITVTHPDMRRYFMTIQEACQLVLQAGSMGEGGEIFILDMGEPVRIVDLAADLITLSGLRVGDDIEIAFSGTRPGEKLFEELSVADEHVDKTRHPRIFVGRIASQSVTAMQAHLATIESAVHGEADAEALKVLLQKVCPEYHRLAAPTDVKQPQRQTVVA